MLLAGQRDQARSQIRAIRFSGLAREQKLRVANLARRAGLNTLAIGILNPIVRSGTKHVLVASAAEKVEYGANLIAIGSVMEGLEFLRSVSPKEQSNTLLFQAFALITQWNYSHAVPLLRNYLEDIRGNAYQSLVAEVNLAACLVYLGQGSEAKRLLESASSRAQNLGARRLLANCAEVAAQLALVHGDFDRCEAALSRARSILGGTGTFDELFVNKWRAVLAIRKGRLTEGLKELEAVKRRAAELKHWETIRDCDFRRASATQDHTLYVHLHFGTPYDGYRLYLKKEFGNQVRIPSSYTWVLNAGRWPRSIDVRRGEADEGRPLSPGQLPHRLLQALAHDYYRPFRPATLFGLLFPEEYFNPRTSPDRVHKAVRRLRGWFGKQKIPLVVQEKDGVYRLDATGPCHLHCAEERDIFGAEIALLTRLFTKALPKEFRANEVAGALGLSRSNAVRLLKWAVDAGKLIRIGGGRSCRYRYPCVSRDAETIPS